MMRHSIPAVLALVAFAGCAPKAPEPVPLKAEVVRQIARTPDAYTQGFQFYDGRIWESTGMYGQSRVREIDPDSGALLREAETGNRYFGEGLTWHNGEIWVLTWREETALVLDPATLAPRRTFRFEGEGWGLTSDGTHLIMSDGTSVLQFREPGGFSIVRTLPVTENGMPVNNINELEFVDGNIFANIYMSARIVRIDATSGHITGALEMPELLSLLPKPNRAEVLNGIAYDPGSKMFFLTGKYWPAIFQVRISEFE